MSLDNIIDLVSRAREVSSAQAPAGSDAAAVQRAKLAGIAADFESMLLGQMLREMRRSGSWDDDEESSGGGFGGKSLFETIDVELSQRLSREKGLGLGQELLKSLERNYAQPAPHATTVPIGQPLAPEPAPAVAPQGVPEATPAGVAPATGVPSSVPVSSNGPSSGPADVTSGFGWRSDPLNGQARFHRGVDIRAAYGDDVRVAAEGRVVFEGIQGGYGTTVVVEHADGIRTRYAHLSASEVGIGDPVAADQVIGRAGRSGRTTGPHLHFEVTAGGRPIDPGAWMSGLPSHGLPSRLKPEAVVADLTVGESGIPDTQGDHHED